MPELVVLANGICALSGGGFGHFYVYAPEKIEYAINRYSMEVKRQLDVLDRHLANNAYLSGNEYSVADIAIWPWYGAVYTGAVYDATEFLDTSSYVMSDGGPSPGTRDQQSNGGES